MTERITGVQIDFTQLSWEQLADVVIGVWAEVKRRNPIGVNTYQTPFLKAASYLVEIGTAEKYNPTAEAGPGVDKHG